MAPVQPRTDEPPAPLDAIIVGAGPIGLETGVALKAAGLRTTVIDAGCIGATIDWWAPGTTFFSSPERIAIAGVPLVPPDQAKATREQYLAYLRGVARQFDLPLRLFTRVDRIERDAEAPHGGFIVEVTPSLHGVGGPEERRRTPSAARASRLRARHVVLAIGDLHRPRMLDVPGEELPHVSHFLDDPHRSFGRRTLVVGGKNSAVEAAIRLFRVGAAVAISYRGERFDPARVKYWLRPEIEWLIEQGRIAFHPRTSVARIGPERVDLMSEADGATRTLDADRVFLLTGYEQSPTLFEEAGIALEGEARAPKLDMTTMETNVPGLFVAGTAVAGTQTRARVFIENSHEHVERICRRIAGSGVPWETAGAVGGSSFAGAEES
ncbi:MAG TPA: NAD(P)-binding domain-containing protein [Phycisphaerales bacterium]|nr:NAD(P)-binding domain-containing protein [Phycisphaerales bacterium]HMP38196.1 NAD(P)-binding domain-containing protein [Phycisphaerales bacterium]